MPRIKYRDEKFKDPTIQLIAQADAICREYEALGITLTLRSLFYQFVSRGLLPNRQNEYKRLGDHLNRARLGGLLDWGHMIDRTRSLRGIGHWDDPAEIISASASSFRVDKWEHQKNYVEVWIEKDAVVGTVDPACVRWDVPYFSCRGYGSQSEVWRAGQRLSRKIEEGKSVTIIHLGDHDPSGIDMTRDIADRLALFTTHHTGVEPHIERIALNMDQVIEYNPPPNPAKVTDSRYSGYVEIHGDESWELDALDPKVMMGLVEDTVSPLIDFEQWEIDTLREDEARQELSLAAEKWTHIVNVIDRPEIEERWTEVAEFAEDPEVYVDRRIPEPPLDPEHPDDGQEDVQWLL